MHTPRKLAVLTLALAVSGCHHSSYAPPESPLPPNTVLLSQMMRELSAQPGFTDTLISQLDKNGKKGPALLTPKLVDNLRQRILGKDWSGLNRFPGWSIHEIDPAVRLVGHFEGKYEAPEAESAIHPGAAPSADLTRTFLDTGPYSLDSSETVSIDKPPALPAFTTEGIVTDLGSEVKRGDGPNSLASEHAQSQWLVYLLNRLAANNLDATHPLYVKTDDVASEAPEPTPASAPGETVDPLKPVPEFHHDSVETRGIATRPEQLVRMLQLTGHTVVVQDARYFANFAHLHYKGQDVMAPFWINTGYTVPHTFGRPLLVPVSHAEYEWQIRGPIVNADISYYFGVDGKAEWRTMDTLDQAWVQKRAAHTYTGDQALEVTRLAGALTVFYMHLHAVHPTMPFGGYYHFGVCQDGVSAIELKMTGHVTLFPNTSFPRLFFDSRDSEINVLFNTIPHDRGSLRASVLASPERIFGSLPVEPGPNNDFSAITIPGLASDLAAAHDAWLHHELGRTSLSWTLIEKLLGGLTGLLILVFLNFRLARRRSRAAAQ